MVHFWYGKAVIAETDSISRHCTRLVLLLVNAIGQEIGWHANKRYLVMDLCISCVVCFHKCFFTTTKFTSRPKLETWEKGSGNFPM